MQDRKTKPLLWVASSKRDLKQFPDDVQDHIGFALYQAQIGLRHRDAKLISGFGPGVIKVVSDFDTNTYRAVYVARFAQAMYVLHAFQKKSTKGIATPKFDIDLIGRRLKAATEHYETVFGKGSQR